MPTKIIFTLLFLCFTLSVSAQDANSKSKIQIDTARTLRGDQVGDKYVQYLSGDVIMSHKGSTMYCDSCVLDEANKIFRAYGNVSIIEADGTMLSAKYVYYNGNNRACSASGDVTLVDGENNIWADNMDYNLDTKVADYKGNGVLQNEETTLWSEYGVYNGKTHLSHFTKDIRIQGPDYDIVSDELKYNTESKEVYFIKYSEVYKDASLMITQGGGYYDSQNEIAEFSRPTQVYNENQSIKANELRYDKKLGYAFARGKVFVEDTTEKVMLFANEGYFMDQKKESIVYGDPVLLRYDSLETDSFFLSADTLRTFDVYYAINTFIEKDSLGNESVTSDTLYRKNFLAWNNVQAYSDSIQSIADSMFLSQVDSTLKLYKEPILWSGDRQMKGDTIYIYWRDKNSLDSVKLLTESSILSVPENIPDGLDQILGNWINIYFEEGDIDSMEDIRNAQCILFIKDEKNEYIGIHKSESQELFASFADGELSRIKMYTDITGEMLPIHGADVSSLRFDQTAWEEEKRPLDKSDFYRRMRFEKKPVEKTEVDENEESKEAPKKSKTEKKSSKQKGEAKSILHS